MGLSKTTYLVLINLVDVNSQDCYLDNHLFDLLRDNLISGSDVGLRLENLMLEVITPFIFGHTCEILTGICGKNRGTFKTPPPLGSVDTYINPFRTAVQSCFYGQTSQIPSSLSPKRDCGSKGVNNVKIRKHLLLFVFFLLFSYGLTI